VLVAQVPVGDSSASSSLSPSASPSPPSAPSASSSPPAPAGSTESPSPSEVPAEAPPSIPTMPLEETPPLLPPPPPLPPPVYLPRQYGDAGTSEASLLFGAASDGGVEFGAGFRHFVVDAVAPGVEATYQTGNGTSLGLLLGSVRFVPLRLPALALVVSARGGRVLLADHDDGWAWGGDAGAIFFFGSTIGLEVGYAVLRFGPARFCADLSTCSLDGPVIGLRAAF
jgi:hypothetical protein